jgi:hypothetical protein
MYAVLFVNSRRVSPADVSTGQKPIIRLPLRPKAYMASATTGSVSSYWISLIIKAGAASIQRVKVKIDVKICANLLASGHGRRRRVSSSMFDSI